MTMTIEKKLRNFTFVGQAATNAAKLTLEELDQLEQKLEESSHEVDSELWSTTEINDLMEFDFEDVCEDWLDLDYETVMARKPRWEE